jgi:hypothetical protein
VRNNAAGSRLVYQPMVIGAAQVRFADKKVDCIQDVTVLSPITNAAVPVAWDEAAPVELAIEDLETTPEDSAAFGDLPAPASKPKSYATWQKDFAGWLYRNRRLQLNRSPSAGVTSNPGESERDFRIRLQQLLREQRDEAVEKLRQKFASKIATLEERKRRAEQAVQREQEQASSQKFQTAISFGATLLSSFMGRKTVSISTLGRATTAVRGVSRTMKESADVGRAEETVAAVTQQLAELDAQFKDDAAEIERSMDSQTEQLETVTMKPTKANINVRLIALAWVPQWEDEKGQRTSAWD